VKLGVVVLTHGDGAPSGELVTQLAREGVPGESTVLVHNTAVTGDCSHPGVTAIHPGRNLGYSAGMNVGIEHLLGGDASHVLVLTHDVRLAPGTIARLEVAAADAPTFGILAPELYHRPGQAFSYGGVVEPGGRLRHRNRPVSALGACGIAECDWADGAALLLNVRMLAQIGLFEERYFIYCEDADLALRGTRLGWRVGTVQEAVAYQAPGKRQRPGAFAYLMSRNGLDYRHRVGGARGLIAGAFDEARACARLARAGVHPRRSADSRRSARAEALARAWGVAHFVRGRWGPPPPRLPGLGDVAG
jgi:N-acetylglucosaminyl-diphospho-decaprenol L-rhamnosyltransferase